MTASRDGPKRTGTSLGGRIGCAALVLFALVVWMASTGNEAAARVLGGGALALPCLTGLAILVIPILLVVLLAKKVNKE